MNHTNTFEIAASWNAGDKGCGQLAVGLGKEVARLEGGQLLELTASDPGARADIPAWCRVTRNPLLLANHPTYIIQKKGE